MAVTPQVVNGWTLYSHPLFTTQYKALARRVMQLEEKDPIGYIKKNETKRFAVIHKLIFEVIPKDPTLPDYRQGSTLGDKYKHWFRAKFFQQYRLFFRFHKQSKTIVYGKMLKSGHPPDDWNTLLVEAKRHYSN